MHRTAAVFVLAILSAGQPASAQNQAKSKSKKPPLQESSRKAPAGLDKTAIAAYIRHQYMLPETIQVLVADPKPSEIAGLQEVTVTVTDGSPMKQEVAFLVSQDGTKLVQGKIYDTRRSPFASELKQIKATGSPRSGAESSPVTLVVYSDFQCQYCQSAAKTIRQNLKGDYAQQVSLVFKDFPLEQIHPWARSASIAGHCIAKAEASRFWEYHDWIFEKQSEFTPENLKSKTLEFANQKGLDTLQLTQCIDGRITEKNVDANIAEGRALQVASTPTLFVNGRRLVGSVPWEQLKRVLDYEIEYAKKNPPKKDEACCEVKLALPATK